MARVYEANSVALRKTIVLVPQEEELTNKDLIQILALLMNRLTLTELRERQEKGSCSKCNEKFGLGHRCEKLFLLEAYRGKDDDGTC